MPTPTHPLLYQVNTRVWLALLSQQSGRPATLDDIPDAALDEMVDLGFDWVYFLGVWQTGHAGRSVSLTKQEWLAEYRQLLVDLCDDDVCGSCFAIHEYRVSDRLGGNAALERLRDRLHQRGLRLMLDFVPNHVAPDHPWVQSHPEFFIHGTEELLAREPQNYCRIALPDGEVILAYGRDPYFAGWSDTLQLNYGNPALQTAMLGELQTIAQQCDGVRCDMAMLILPEIFQRVWGVDIEPFWQAAMKKMRYQHPDFVFVAEVYWDLESTLQQCGFDYTYDKRLYDRLREQRATPVREHFEIDRDYQNKSVRFLENHDEPRAATTLPPEVHRAAAILTYLCPGLRFFHQGQMEGFKHRISVHLQRGPTEPIDEDLYAFYSQLLHCLQLPILREGAWQLVHGAPAWDSNNTWKDCISFVWNSAGSQLLVIVNYAPHPSQCYITLPDAPPITNLTDPRYYLKDLMSSMPYECSDDRLTSGLYFDLPAWGYHVFDLPCFTQGT